MNSKLVIIWYIYIYIFYGYNTYNTLYYGGYSIYYSYILISKIYRFIKGSGNRENGLIELKEYDSDWTIVDIL